jgi:hypothetical protein
MHHGEPWPATARLFNTNGSEFVPNVIFVPGFLSSELCEDAELRVILWAEYSRLMEGTIGFMRLAANGVDPGPPDGRPLFYGAPLFEYWAEPTKRLQAQLAPHGYQVFTFGWDWRKDFFAAGDRLAANIVRTTPADDPCTIVAHSFGGLVARRAWATLTEMANANLVRRIVTLGSPHQGTYAPYWLACGLAEYFDQLQFLNNLGNNITLRSGVVGYGSNWTIGQIRDLALTWPSVYQLFPLLGGTDAAGDVLRSTLFDHSNWPASLPISAEHLSNAKDVIGPWLLSPASLPPSWVMTTVSGSGVMTPNRLQYPNAIGTVEVVGQTAEGDGVVTRSSAEITGSAVYSLACRHTDLPLTTVNSGDLAAWVLDPRAAPSPAPPPVQIPGALTPLLSGPPIANSFGGFSTSMSCKGGKCTC